MAVVFNLWNTYPRGYMCRERPPSIPASWNACPTGGFGLIDLYCQQEPHMVSLLGCPKETEPAADGWEFQEASWKVSILGQIGAAGQLGLSLAGKLLACSKGQWPTSA